MFTLLMLSKKSECYMNYLTQKLPSSYIIDIKINSILSLLLAYADEKDNGGTKLLCLRVQNQGITIHTENAPFRHCNL